MRKYDKIFVGLRIFFGNYQKNFSGAQMIIILKRFYLGGAINP
jgi:hypothetical protein